ncbi:putative RNA-directed DNA polymerase from transposon BS [Folsomia candida]|uniref:Putative RNA-directed DNA polymerase from transposon BS n=1 Tax=Folsomia candida TaxID=158441 RepID=A0A226D7L8_FOLCA|nr:putative RNA-directed DNA polymerase from transposon BS [Folsomia candida]
MNEFGGGVAILFRESLTHKRIQLERHELAKAEPKFTVSNSDIDEMELLFSEHLEKQCNFYICGDFNIHMEDTNNTQIKKFQNLLKRLSLRELVNGPTRGKARLDLIITNDNDENTQHKVDSMINTRGVWTVKKQLIDNKAQKIDIDPDTLNNYYCSVSNESTLTPCPSKPPNFPFSSKSTFTFKPVDYKILISQFRKLKNSSKTQPDITGLSPLMLKLTIGSPNVISGILNIINKSLLESQFPENLKTSVITPIPKQNDATEPIHFRPVAAQPFLSLLIEKCAHNQIMTYLSEHNILYQGQFGFRPFHSCETAMIALIDSVHNQINLGNICILVSLDLSKAFDVLVREFLLEKLRWYGIDPKWFSAYLSYRSQVVKGANGKLSHVKFTIHGCPQGSVIGPLIFCVYVNDLPLLNPTSWLYKTGW